MSERFAPRVHENPFRPAQPLPSFASHEPQGRARLSSARRATSRDILAMVTGRPRRGEDTGPTRAGRFRAQCAKWFGEFSPVEGRGTFTPASVGFSAPLQPHEKMGRTINIL